MNLLVGTTAGAFSLDDPSTPLVAGRINHISRHGDRWWAVDGEGGVHYDGEIVAKGPEGVNLKLCPAHP